MLATARLYPLEIIAQPTASMAGRLALVAGTAEDVTLRADRLQFGPVAVDVRSFASQRSIQLIPSDKMVYLVVPLRGVVVAVTPGEQFEVRPGSALLLVRRERTDCIWPTGAEGLVLHVPRLLVQAQAFTIFGEPRRLAGTRLMFDCNDPGSHFGTVIAPLAPNSAPIDPTDLRAIDLGQSIVAGLVDVVRTSGAGTVGFAVSGSVKRAIDHMRADPDTHISPEQLARIAGVTLVRLRRNFKECLGITLAAYLQQERLEWARRRLGSSKECRSIAELALACGMSGSGVFTRVYQRRFEETPTQTRARAFT